MSPWDTKFAADAFGADDSVLPTIVNVSPAPGTPDIPRNQTITFDVRDAGGLQSVTIRVQQTIEEVCFDGVGFVAPYFAGSSTPTEEQVANEDGTFTTVAHFTMRRSGGWVTPPTFRVVPIDCAGNEGI